MGLTVDGDSTFGDGPSVVTEGPWAHRRKDSVFPAVSGVRRLEMGTGGRKLTQAGLLVATGTDQAAAIAALQEVVDAIEALKGLEVELVTEDGRKFQHLAFDGFGFTRRIIVRQTATNWEARRAYRVAWTQLAPNDP